MVLLTYDPNEFLFYDIIEILNHRETDRAWCLILELYPNEHLYFSKQYCNLRKQAKYIEVPRWLSERIGLIELGG